MRSRILFLILIFLIAIGAWFGYQELRRRQLLASGERVLLINKGEGIYAYSDMVDPEGITRDFKAIDYLDKITPDELARLTEGLSFIATSGANTLSSQAKVVLPAEGEELERWASAVVRLSPGQRELCQKIVLADFSQACVMRHVIATALAEADSALCSAIYLEYFRNECVQTLENGNNTALMDQDRDGLIDSYEFYADPESFQPNV